MDKLPCPNKYCRKLEKEQLTCEYKEDSTCTRTVLIIAQFTKEQPDLAEAWLKGKCMNDICEYKQGEYCGKDCCRPSWCLWKKYEG